MPYFTKNEAGEFVEVADDAVLEALDITKHPKYVSADERIKKLNKENESRRKQLQAALKQDDEDESETPEPVEEKPKKAKPEPAPEIDIDKIVADAEARVLQKIAAATNATRSHEEALDALIAKHSLPSTLKPALKAAGSIDAATVLAKTLGDAKLQFPEAEGGNGSANLSGVVSQEALDRIAKDLTGIRS